MSIHRNYLAWLIPVLLIPVLLTACVSSSTIKATADQDGNIEVEVTVEIEPEGDSVTASAWQTREVDPLLLANNAGYPHSGTIILALADGTTVSYSQGLDYDAGTTASAVRAGHEALVYRSENPQALQNFLDQYWHRAVSGTIITSVGLSDISPSSEATIVDVQSTVEGQTQYVGSGSVTTEGSGAPFQQDQ